MSLQREPLPAEAREAKRKKKIEVLTNPPHKMTVTEAEAAPMGDGDATTNAEPVPCDEVELSQEPRSASKIEILSDPAVTAYIDKKIQEGVAEGIKEALKGQAPKADLTEPDEEQRRTFQRMTYRERLNLKLASPHIYNALVQKGK